MVLAIGLILGFDFAPIHISKADENKESGVLDGKVFAGKIGPSDQTGYDDRLYFAEGKFWSEICVRCGFKPGKYWTRNEDDGIHFIGEMNGDYGTFNYEGRIIDGKAKVEVVWQKERWYWTSSRKLIFEGSTKPGEISYPAIQASKNAIDALLSELPDYCWR